MRLILATLALFLALMPFGCTTATTDKSYELGAKGEFKTSFYYEAAPDELRSAALKAMAACKFEIKPEANGYRATLDHGGVFSTMLVTFGKDTVFIDTAGSQIDGTPIMPLRRVDQFKRHMAKNLANF